MRLLKRLHQWDVLRANKAPFAWGVETRVPFLDKAFLDLVMNIDPQEKMVRCCNRSSFTMGTAQLHQAFDRCSMQAASQDIAHCAKSIQVLF